MELEYVTIQTIMAEDFSYLTDEEAGKAIKAYLNYATSGESKAPEGNAIFVYLSLKREFDRVMKIREERAEAGRAGGRPKKAKPEPAQLNPETKQKPEVRTPASFISDEEAAEIQQGTNEVLDEAKRQGFPDTTATMETLNQLVADNGTEEVLECVKIAGEAGKPNIRYLKGVINGRAKERQEEERQARIDAEKYPVVSSADYDYKPPSVTFGEVFKKYAKQRALEHPEERVKLEELAGRFS
jgi:hypothetical protein